MITDLDFLTLLLLALLPFIPWAIFQAFLLVISLPWKSPKFPPGPFPLPIVGSLFHLGKNPHQSLAKLSKIYGPLMHLKLGSMHTIVVSSPEIAKQMLQKHDIAFSNRAVPYTAQLGDHHKSSLAWLPAEGQWRNLRRICKEHMFSTQKLDASKGLRLEKLQQLHEYVHECCSIGKVLNIGELTFITTVNLVSCTLFSVDFADFDASTVPEIKETFQGLMRTLAAPNLADYFPVLKSFDLQGIMRENSVYSGKLFDILEGVINERLESRRNNCARKNDLLEELLNISQESGSEFTIHDIKHLLLDLILAGVDTTAATVEWAMTELIRDQSIMSKAKNELYAIIGDNKQVEESDIDRLPYLNAVIKETFRLHPAGPFLVPHQSTQDIEINGYMIPKYAQILVNVWATGRDSKIWPNAHLFEPERFLDSKIDFKGQDFELIPFGSGRRICPGLPLAQRMVHLTVAYLIHNFNWKIDSSDLEELDMSEKFGLSVHKAIPLQVIPIKP